MKQFYASVAHVAETLVFLFLGIAFAAFSHPFTRTGWEMIVGVIVIVMIA